MVASIKPYADEMALGDARMLIGGERLTAAAGNFVTPTLFADVSNDMSSAREEIFGPVLSDDRSTRAPAAAPLPSAAKIVADIARVADMDALAAI